MSRLKTDFDNIDKINIRAEVLRLLEDWGFGTTARSTSLGSIKRGKRTIEIQLHLQSDEDEFIDESLLDEEHP